MQITTRVSSTPVEDGDHHYECTRDHPIHRVTFISCTASKGFGRGESYDCMFFEMEDAAEASICDAIQTSVGSEFADFDYDEVRDAAAGMAAEADHLIQGTKHMRCTVAVA